MLEVNIKKKDGVEVVSLLGVLNVDTISLFQSKFTTLSGEKIVLNMKNIDYISSAGLRGLVLLFEYANEKNGRVVLCSLSPVVKEVVEISGFEALFVLKDSEDDAVKELL